MQVMKRLSQFVVFALVLLGAAQPLLADIDCAQQRCGAIPDCSMHLGCMATPDSVMQSLFASTQATSHVAFAEAGCSYGFCRLRSDSTALLMATPPTFRLASSSTLLMPVAQFSASPAVNLAATSSEDAAAVAVPRHILFQVFRI
jgi:hypothetical protein